MTEPSPSKPSSPQPPSSLDPSQIRQLQAEARAPFRSLRRFFYIAFAGAGFIGGFIFLFKLLAGEDFSTTFPNLILQVGVIALMVWLLQVDSSPSS